MRKIYLAGIALVAAGIAVIGPTPEEESGDESRSTGWSEFPVEFEETSLKGYHRIDGLSVAFRANGGASASPVEAKAIHQRPWPMTLDEGSRTFIPGYWGQSIRGTLDVNLPEGFAGQSGAVVASGVVRFVTVKEVEEGVADVGEEALEFEREWPVTVVADGVQSPDEDSNLELRRNVGTGVLLGGLLVLIAGFVGVGYLLTFVAIGGVTLFLGITFFDLATEVDRLGGWSPTHSFRVVPKVDVKAPDGLHVTEQLTAWIKGAADDQIEVAAEATGDKPFGNSITVGHVRLGPAFKTNRFAVKPSVTVKAPGQELVGGKECQVLVSGVILYPEVSTLDAVNPLSREFEVKPHRYYAERSMQFAKDPHDVRTGADPPLPMKILLTITGLCAFAIAGRVLWRVKEAVFG